MIGAAVDVCRGWLSLTSRAAYAHAICDETLWATISCFALHAEQYKITASEDDEPKKVNPITRLNKIELTLAKQFAASPQQENQQVALLELWHACVAHFARFHECLLRRPALIQDSKVRQVRSTFLTALFGLAGAHVRMSQGLVTDTVGADVEPEEVQDDLLKVLSEVELIYDQCRIFCQYVSPVESEAVCVDEAFSKHLNRLSNVVLSLLDMTKFCPMTEAVCESALSLASSVGARKMQRRLRKKLKALRRPARPIPEIVMFQQRAQDRESFQSSSFDEFANELIRQSAQHLENTSRRSASRHMLREIRKCINHGERYFARKAESDHHKKGAKVQLRHMRQLGALNIALLGSAHASVRIDLPSSDFDVILYGDVEHTQALMDSLAQQLRNAPFTRGKLEYRRKARVPVILCSLQLRNLQSPLDVDISVLNDTEAQKLIQKQEWMGAQFDAIDAVLRQRWNLDAEASPSRDVARMAKLEAKRRRICDSPNGRLNSFSLTLLTIATLRHCKDEVRSTREALALLFQALSKLGTIAIDTHRQNSWFVPKKSLPRHIHAKLFVILDPLDATDNAARSVRKKGAFNAIRKAAESASTYFSEAPFVRHFNQEGTSSYNNSDVFDVVFGSRRSAG
ncbi:MAG: hypothetical protein MHM6MM_004235 [Cercozoa sp. M6MM]